MEMLSGAFRFRGSSTSIAWDLTTKIGKDMKQLKFHSAAIDNSWRVYVTYIRKFNLFGYKKYVVEGKMKKSKVLSGNTCFWFCYRWLNNNMHCNNRFLKLTKGNPTLTNILAVLQNPTTTYNLDIIRSLRTDLLI